MYLSGDILLLWINLQVFDNVREAIVDFKSKIVPVVGDIAEENLGLSEEDWEMLQENIEIVFHSAATVRFDEDLKWVYKPFSVKNAKEGVVQQLHAGLLKFCRISVS